MQWLLRPWAALLLGALLSFSSGLMADETAPGGSPVEETQATSPAPAPNTPQALVDKYRPQLERLHYVMDMIKAQGAVPVEDEDLIMGGLKGMMKKLDPYSVYLSDKENKKWKEHLAGEFGGLGITIGIEDNVLTVISPLEDTPAWRAGLQSGDQIIKIEGESTDGITIDDAVGKMRGLKGTTCNITIFRASENTTTDYAIVRDIIKIKSVKSAPLNDRVGYVRISNFQEHTSQELREAIAALHQGPDGKDHLQGLVLDLRGNSGGLLKEANAVADIFLKEGLVVYTQGRQANNRRNYVARTDGTEPDYPMVVLVNKGSASASEIVTGALKDHRRALVVGQTTFGKGSVQNFFPLTNGDSLKMTTQHYFTPNGNNIHLLGIKPDVSVEPLPRNVIAEMRRTREEAGEEALENGSSMSKPMREADLPGHLKNEEGYEEEGGAVPDSYRAQLEKINVDYDLDTQLQRAVGLLQGFSAIAGPPKVLDRMPN